MQRLKRNCLYDVAKQRRANLLCEATLTATELSKNYCLPWAGADAPDRCNGSHPGQSLAILWRRPGSNRQPPACKTGALPIELRPRGPSQDRSSKPVGVLGFEPRTSALSELRSSQLSYTPKHRGKQKSQTRLGLALPASRCRIERHPPSRMLMLIWRLFMKSIPTRNRDPIPQISGVE